ncbi:MAG: MoaD/ThiS family protein [Gemmataceae bacterium]
MARQRAGRAELAAEAHAIRDLLWAVERACPGLEGLIREDGRLSPHYLLSLDGQRFVDSLDEPLRPGQRVLLLSADAGG